jgi:hypothetical protein
MLTYFDGVCRLTLRNEIAAGVYRTEQNKGSLVRVAPGASDARKSKRDVGSFTADKPEVTRNQ